MNNICVTLGISQGEGVVGGRKVAGSLHPVTPLPASLTAACQSCFPARGLRNITRRSQKGQPDEETKDQRQKHLPEVTKKVAELAGAKSKYCERFLKV